ncbi:DUF4920 domain-containing protein [Salinimicrobium sp. GXAS 041]|uniref:DUF4920 domain-containing protein n=1 Tax=Salinimicrobium sp. GXAS 041 TaxID=3400806 RepID=UPI003C762FA1
MKKLSMLLFIFFVAISCKDKPQSSMEEDLSITTNEFPASYSVVGEGFQNHEVLSAEEMNEKFQNLEVGDTVDVRFESSVNSVCKKKGCWMNLELPGEKEVMVKFKDYAFFVPKDIEEQEVVVNGKAYVSEVSVDDQRHFAEDAGKSPEEVAAIVEPKKTWSFLADGVAIKKN